MQKNLKTLIFAIFCILWTQLAHSFHDDTHLNISEHLDCRICQHHTNNDTAIESLPEKSSFIYIPPTHTHTNTIKQVYTTNKYTPPTRAPPKP